jgi:hypothetical protein
MAIRQVNGKNAYVIEVAQPTAKTSRGEGYAQLITNLRWKMWEEAQKSELMALEFEKMAYQQQLRLFQTQQKAVQDEIDATKRAINALNRAELSRDQQLENNLTSAQNSERRRRASAEESRLRQQSSQEFAGQETTTTRTGTGSGATRSEDILADLSSDTNDSFQRVQEQAALASASETDPTLRIESSVARAEQQGNYQIGAGGGVSAGEGRTFKAAVVAAEIKKARDAALAAGTDPAAAEATALNKFSADYQSDYSSVVQPTSEPDGAGGDGTSVRGERAAKPIDAPVPTAGTGKATAVDYSAERERLQAELADLQTQLGGLQLPAIPNVDLLERTRGKFQSAYGEGGFGLAPRPTRALPRFDEPAATAAAQDIAAFGADKAVADFRAANPDVELNPQQIASLRRQGVLGMLNEMGGREVAEKDFLDFRTTEPATSPRQEQPAPARELPPLADEEEPPSQPEPLRIRRDVPISTGQQPMGVGQLPVSGELEQQLLEEDQRRMQMGQPPQQFGTIPPQQESREQTALEFLREMEALGYGDAAMERLRNEFLLRQQGAEQFYQQQIPTETYQPPPTLAQRILPSPVDRRTPAGRLAEETGEGLSTQPSQITNLRGEVIGEGPSPAARQEQRAETQQNKVLERRNAYKLRMIERATTLANQPKKFERIAKTNLPPEERAKKVADYVLVVDNLYVANQREGGDPILPSYEEINRVYADDPRTREQATSYLLAKQILDVKVENPE